MCTKNHNQCTAPGMQSKKDGIFCHFGPFLSFYPPNDPENQNFLKLKKMPGDIIMCTINEDHMIYGS